MGFREYLEKARCEGAFIEHTAGDTASFRYPHVGEMSGLFAYDARLRCWRLSIDEEEGRSDGVGASIGARGFAAEDIGVYEYLSPCARRIHCLDLIGIGYGDDLRERAFVEVRELYGDRARSFPHAELASFCADGLPVRGEFSYLRELFRDVGAVPVRMLRVEADLPWPFGSVLKGTDLVVTDGTRLNIGQDVVHALFHLHEGIPGVDGDNLFVRELWAPVPALYALQLAEGRPSRRTRLRSSPHPIRFTDYVYLRAYLGQGFAPDDADAPADAAHPAFAVIEPAIRLMVSALDEKDAWERNRILADAVLADKADELAACFDGRYGAGSFSSVFGTRSLYARRRRALEFVEEGRLDDIMFGGEPLLPTRVPQDVVERLWKDAEARADAYAVLDMLGFG